LFKAMIVLINNGRADNMAEKVVVEVPAPASIALKSDFQPNNPWRNQRGSASALMPYVRESARSAAETA